AGARQHPAHRPRPGVLERGERRDRGRADARNLGARADRRPQAASRGRELSPRRAQRIAGVAVCPRGRGVDETLYDANVRAWRLAESARETQRHEAPGTELRLGKPATVPIRWGIAL